MSEQPIEAPSPLFDARHGKIRRYERFLRDYLNGRHDVIPDLYYRLVVDRDTIKIVTGAQLVANAELFAEQRRIDTLRAAFAASRWPDRFHAAKKHALRGLAMYATPFVPIP